MKCTSFAGHQQLLSFEPAEEFDQFGDETSPARLVASPQSCAVISVEVFVKQNVVFPVRIGLEFLCTSIDRSSAGFVTQKDPCQSSGDFPGDLKQIHQLA